MGTSSGRFFIPTLGPVGGERVQRRGPNSSSTILPGRQSLHGQSLGQVRCRFSTKHSRWIFYLSFGCLFRTLSLDGIHSEPITICTSTSICDKSYLSSMQTIKKDSLS